VVAHLLARDPFGLPLAAIAELDPVQVKRVYLRDDLDDETGLPAALHADSASKGKSRSPKEVFWTVLREWRGLSEEETQRRWQEHQQSAATSPPLPPRHFPG
jgi:hypothetical protein